MYQTIACCDVCGRTKREANHWHLLDAATFKDGEGFNLTGWSDAAAKQSLYLFLCSAECVTKMLNKYLERK